MGTEHPGSEGYKKRTEYMMKRADYVVAVMIMIRNITVE